MNSTKEKPLQEAIVPTAGDYVLIQEEHYFYTYNPAIEKMVLDENETIRVKNTGYLIAPPGNSTYPFSIKFDKKKGISPVYCRKYNAWHEGRSFREKMKKLTTESI